jgi:hypothetical protein
MKDSKKAIIFAGINGAGKSTFYNMSQDIPDFKETIRINTDEIVREIGDWRNDADQMKAGKIGIKLRNEAIRQGKSFNEETTLCGKTIIKLFEKLKENGYKIDLYIDLYYVGLKNSDIALERIKNRVANGGHDIPAEKVRKRYEESRNNLEKVIPLCDSVSVFDNSESFRRLATIKEGKLIQKADKVPFWFNSKLKNLISSGKVKSNALAESRKNEKNKKLITKKERKKLLLFLFLFFPFLILFLKFL